MDAYERDLEAEVARLRAEVAELRLVLDSAQVSCSRGAECRCRQVKLVSLGRAA